MPTLFTQIFIFKYNSLDDIYILVEDGLSGNFGQGNGLILTREFQRHLHFFLYLAPYKSCNISLSENFFSFKDIISKMCLGFDYITIYISWFFS